MILNRLILLLFFSFLVSCNNNKTDEELKIKLKELSVAMGSATYDPGASQTPITGITNFINFT